METSSNIVALSDTKTSDRAIVTGGLFKGLEDVQNYLPSNFTAQELNGRIVIFGVPNAGWTLEDYVIPRLSSGLIAAVKFDSAVDIAKGFFADASSAVRADIPAAAKYLRFFKAAANVATLIGLEAPTDAEIERGMTEWNGIAPARKGLWKPIQKPRGDAGDLMKFWHEWHAGRSGGSLWGVMGRQSKESDRWDSLVQVSRSLGGGKTSLAASRWADALGGAK
jgi:hypothetical protein